MLIKRDEKKKFVQRKGREKDRVLTKAGEGEVREKRKFSRKGGRE